MLHFDLAVLQLQQRIGARLEANLADQQQRQQAECQQAKRHGDTQCALAGLRRPGLAQRGFLEQAVALELASFCSVRASSMVASSLAMRSFDSTETLSSLSALNSRIIASASA